MQDGSTDLRSDRAVLIAAAVLALACGSYGAYCGLLIWSGNFHTVAVGRLYRSAELTRDEFATTIEAHHVRAVLNLRGAHPEDRWYQDEVAATGAHGADHYDIAISAREPVPEGKIEAILAVLRTAPKPLLVHCRSGADRTGFVSALYRYAIEGESAGEAARELSVWYGHFPYLTSTTVAMDESASAYFRAHPHASSE